ncbi:hypothetical protein KMZ29_18405 [Bradyrhizobium sediminis]|uniref:Uncharacterized protein n=1 Tax=Bradyrhizobium sediminis TaxID=2840469 RepID=A0A975NBD8_9BRAD|nr:hypothetical protein [Bradyrhizobium sediminis]QWG11690.1 hypothetical protein KMZ29_18405 [Bradyrhizobium sediminis]
MSNYLRAFVPGGCSFFTIDLLERRKSLLVDRIAILRKVLAMCIGAVAGAADHAFGSNPPYGLAGMRQVN